MSDIQDLLVTEQEYALWGPEVRGIKLWPLIRTDVLLDIIARERGYSTSPRVSRTTKYLSPQQWKRYYRTLNFLLFNSRHKYTHLFFTNNLSRYKVTGEAMSFDRLHEELFKHAPEPLIFETWQVPRPMLPDRQFEQRILSQDLLWLLSWLISKRNRLRNQESAEIRSFMLQIAKAYRIQDDGSLSDTMGRLIRQYTPLRSIFKRFIHPKLRVGVAFLEIAAYLGRQAILSKILHEFNYKVFEYQHGVISENHPAYNYPHALNTDQQHPSRQYLPDTLLTFGKGWSSKIDMPANIIPVGAPYLSKIVERVKKDGRHQRNSILVISQWTVTERLIRISTELAKAFPEKEILFKLHPAEIPSFTAIQRRLTEPNIKVLGSDDVYKLISESPIIIGFNSTALIEATAFQGKRIFFSDPVNMPGGIGGFFHDTEELISLIKNPETGYPTVAGSDLWEPNWEETMERVI